MIGPNSRRASSRTRIGTSSPTSSSPRRRAKRRRPVFLAPGGVVEGGLDDAKLSIGRGGLNVIWSRSLRPVALANHRAAFLDTSRVPTSLRIIDARPYFGAL